MFINPLVHSRRRGSVPVVAAILAGTLGTLNLASAADVTLPASAALPTTSTLGPAGFTVRTALAPAESVLANSYLRALKQLNGSLLDDAGAPYGNIASQGPNSDGSFDVDFINFSLTPEGDYGQFVFTDTGDPSFPDAVFPGLFEEGPTTHFSTEVLTFLNLPAGTYTFGITAQNDRTDVNDDDGWRLVTGLNPRSYFATTVAEFQHTAKPFVVDKKGNVNEFNVVVTTPGIYPFRLTYWQTGRGAQLEWYIVLDPESEFPTRLLLNDPSAAYAYRSVAVPAANGPYTSSIAPPPDSSGVSPTSPIEAVLVDGEKPIDLASVKLFLNGAAVTPQTLVRDGRYVRLQYSPNAARVNPNNAIRLEYKDTAGLAVTDSWSFTITASGAPRTVVRGQWDFDNGSLGATVGRDLEYLDGPGGIAEAATSFGTTTDFGIADIGGVPARVMKVTGDLNTKIGYKMFHGIAPNGGGTRVNQYTLIMDIYVHPVRGGAASLLQASSLANTDDGDLFWQGSNFGQGGGGYNGTGAFKADGWHRVIAAVDEAAGVVTKYVDGIKQDDWVNNPANPNGHGLDNARRTLQSYALLFADGDNDERAEMYVNSVQIREGKLSDSEMVLLGGPEAGGIPSQIDDVNVTGQWDFDAGNLAATVGKPLEYLDGDVAEGISKAATAFGTTADFGIPGINGADVKVMQVSGDLNPKIGYKMFHGISPNGGGTRVNQYTIIFDIYLVPVRGGAASLLQASSLENTDDGDLFWQGSNFGQGGGGYNGTGAFTPNAWHRVSAAVDEVAGVVTKYVDGIKQDDWVNNPGNPNGHGLDHPRRTLQSYALLFADGDNDERAQVYVNSVQIRPGKLTDAQLTLLGGPSASGIPLVLPSSSVTGQWDFDAGNLAATIGKPLEYLDGDNAEGASKAATTFGTTTDLVIDGINGEEAKVLQVTGDLNPNIGYKMFHGIAPNGGGTRVNQYTLIMDLYVHPVRGGAASLLQVSSLANTDDGDLFWQGSNFGQGGGGYNGTGAFTPNAWHRVAISFDEGSASPSALKYVDGIFQDKWVNNPGNPNGHGLDNARRTLQSYALLFADGDNDERAQITANSIQIRAGTMSASELASLGGPSASGIPIATPPAVKAASRGGLITLQVPAWAIGYVVESTTSLEAPNWQSVGVTTGLTFSYPATGPAAYFRLRAP